MSVKEKQAFIKDLAAEHRRCRPLMLPSRRALLWFILSIAVSAGLMHHEQTFRPGFAGQLEHHPFFLLEVASALLFVPLAAYVALSKATPGERTPRGAIAGLGILALLFIVGFGAGFTPLAPETATVGARHACWMEVVAYGVICLSFFAIIVRRGFVRFSWKLGLLYGLMAGLVPATLMQLACMYNPMHALIFHYLPIVVLIPLGLAIMRFVHRS